MASDTNFLASLARSLRPGAPIAPPSHVPSAAPPPPPPNVGGRAASPAKKENVPPAFTKPLSPAKKPSTEAPTPAVSVVAPKPKPSDGNQNGNTIRANINEAAVVAPQTLPDPNAPSTCFQPATPPAASKHPMVLRSASPKPQSAAKPAPAPAPQRQPVISATMPAGPSLRGTPEQLAEAKSMLSSMTQGKTTSASSRGRVLSQDTRSTSLPPKSASSQRPAAAMLHSTGERLPGVLPKQQRTPASLALSATANSWGAFAANPSRTTTTDHLSTPVPKSVETVTLEPARPAADPVKLTNGARSNDGIAASGNAAPTSTAPESSAVSKVSCKMDVDNHTESAVPAAALDALTTKLELQAKSGLEKQHPSAAVAKTCAWASTILDLQRAVHDQSIRLQTLEERQDAHASAEDDFPLEKHEEILKMAVEERQSKEAGGVNEPFKVYVTFETGEIYAMQVSATMTVEDAIRRFRVLAELSPTEASNARISFNGSELGLQMLLGQAGVVKGSRLTFAMKGDEGVGTD